MSNSQDIAVRRVYLIKPRQKLMDMLASSNAPEVIDDVSQPHVVSTELLPFEEYLEGWRSKILELCKVGFITENIIEYPLIPINMWIDIPRIDEVSIEAFDLYWIAEEATFTNIPTTWK